MKSVKKNTVLIIDGGGRGSVLVDKYSQSKLVSKIIAIPGNDLMTLNKSKPVKIFSDLKTTSVSEIIDICHQEKVDLVDVAQDNAIAVGLVDELIKNNIPVFGPTQKAGQLEWDKSWSRQFMKKYQLPIPEFYVFDNPKSGYQFLDSTPNKPWFIKASGLAEGKGVIPANNNQEAKAAVDQMSKFGQSGQTYLLEEWLVGEEFSAFAVVDGVDFQIIGFAQDHKRVDDYDQGPNTGGMGCVSNPLIVNKKNVTQIKNIFQKTVSGMVAEGRPYQGILYLGGMVVGQKVYIIEFNCRWGDPEAQVIIPSIKNDLIDISFSVINHQLKTQKIKTDSKTRIVVTAASRGYPVNYNNVKGKQIFGLSKIFSSKKVKIFGAGTQFKNNQYIANGGRLFYLVSEGKNITDARKKVYNELSGISIEGNNLHYRTDIGWRDVQRLNK
ncbi:MAG: phosphoribosylamine--glycine ligase [Candidatus Shapirobacteria bacterium]|nr:phosphoribosylamine--glycine ligase [Candidatus Shapirobacteria bacterium]